jgi:hypothetical protein
MRPPVPAAKGGFGLLHGRPPLAPFLLPLLLLFSSGGQGQNPQVAAVDRRLRLGIGLL